MAHISVNTSRPWKYSSDMGLARGGAVVFAEERLIFFKRQLNRWMDNGVLKGCEERDTKMLGGMKVTHKEDGLKVWHKRDAGARDSSAECQKYFPATNEAVNRALRGNSVSPKTIKMEQKRNS